MNKITFRVGTFAAIIWLLLFLLSIFGYFENIVKICMSVHSPITVELLIRLVGVLVFPLGVVAGYF